MPKGTRYMFHLTSCHLTISDKNRNGHEKSSQVLINIKNLLRLKFSLKTFDFFLCLKCALKPYFAQKLGNKAKIVRGCFDHTKLLKSCSAQSEQA